MYITVDTLTRELGQFHALLLKDLIIPGGEGKEDDTSALDALITEASEFIDGYICQAVTTPLDPVPKLIASICLFICVKKVWALKNSKDIPAHVQKDYDNALKLLQQINSGTLKLTSADPQNASFYDLKYSVSPRVFGTSL